MNFDQFVIELIRALAWPVAFYSAFRLLVEYWEHEDD